MKINHQNIDFANLFFDKAKLCLEFDSRYIIENNKLLKNESYEQKTSIEVFWIVFSTGVELLLKSILVKHNCFDFKKKDILKKIGNLSNKATNYSDCLRVYEYIESSYVSLDSRPDLSAILKSKEISRLYEINFSTLGECQSMILKLYKSKILTEQEHLDTYNSIQTLSDIRRNFDVHGVSPLRVFGSINGDLDRLYIPMINLMLSK